MKKFVQVGLALVALDVAAHFTENPTMVALWNSAKDQMDKNDELHRAYGLALELSRAKPDMPLYLILAANLGSETLRKMGLIK